MKRRILSSVICFLMVLTLLPTVAMAESLDGILSGPRTIAEDSDVSGGTAYSVTPTGVLTINEGVTLTINDGSALDIAGGALINNGTLSIEVGGTLINFGSITNNGTLTIEAGGLLTNTGKIFNKGVFSGYDINSNSDEHFNLVLSGLATNTGTLSPAFSSTARSYSLTTDQPGITITPTLASQNTSLYAFFKKDGNTYNISGSTYPTIPLTDGANTIEVVVGHADSAVCSETNTYTLSVNKTSDPNMDLDYTMDFTQTNATWGGLGGVDLTTTDASGTGWHWACNTKTLTLGYNNTAFNFTTTADAAVKLPAGAKVELVSGTVNTLTGGAASGGSSHGIYSGGGLTFLGAGKLTVTAGVATATASTSVESSGIYANGPVNFTGSADVTANGGRTVVESYGLYAGGRVTASGSSKLTANSFSDAGICYGLRADGVSLSESAELTADGGDATLWSYGIYSSGAITAKDSSELKAMGGAVSGTGSTDGAGIYCSLSVTVTDDALIDGRSGFSNGIMTGPSGSVHYEGGRLIAWGPGGQKGLSSAPVMTEAPDFFVWRNGSTGEYKTKNTYNAGLIAASTYAELSDTADFPLYLAATGLIFKGNDRGGEDITTAFAGLLSFDGASEKWIMNGLDFKTSAPIAMRIEQTSGSNALLALSGTNSLLSIYNGSDLSTGISSSSTLVVSGTGSLSLSPGKSSIGSVGISANGFTLEGGALDVTVGEGSAFPCGINSGFSGMSISGGSLTVNVAGAGAIGLLTNRSLDISGGTTEITTGNVAIMASPDGTAKTMSFTGGMADASGRYITAGSTKAAAVYLPNATAADINNNSDADRRYIKIEPKATLSLSPAALDFGNVPVGTTPSKAVTITNNGNYPVNINGGSFSPGTAATCYSFAQPVPSSIAAGASATFILQLKSAAAAIAGQKPEETLTITGTKGEVASFTINCNVVNVYSVTYNANGGGGSMANGTATEGVAFTMPERGFTAPAGMRFKEWAIGSTGGTKVAAGGTHTFTADTTVYAVWEALPAVFAPTFSPTGGTYTSAQSVTISCATSGATIRYTTDGTEPTATSTLYTAPIVVAKTMTIKAKSFKSGMNASTVASVSYTINTEYQVIEGENGEWTKGSASGLGFTANGEFSEFTSVWVDGSPLAEDKYTAASGSAIITLKAAYLETLSVGVHTLRINFTDGYAETSFTIKAASGNPETGDGSMIWLWVTTALLAAAGLALCVAPRTRRRKAQ